MPGNAFGELVRVDSVGNLLLLLLLLLLFYLGGVEGREYVEVLRAVQRRGSSHRKVAFLCAERGFEFIYRYRESFCVLQYLQNSEILRYSRERIKMSFP